MDNWPLEVQVTNERGRRTYDEAVVVSLGWQGGATVRHGKAFEIPGGVPGLASISFVTEAGQHRTVRPTPELLHLPIARNRPSRRPATHPLRRSTEGFYWFEQTGHHVWHESMEEYTALMLLDHMEDVAAICTQPLRIDFADGARHFPDLFIVYRDGRQELGNVRPRHLIDDRAVRQFQATAQVGSSIGWGHRLIVDISLRHRNNLELLASKRHPRHEPTDGLAELFLQLTDDVGRFGPLWAAAQRFPGPAALAGLHNLMWHREIVFDMSNPLELNTPVWRP